MGMKKRKIKLEDGRYLIYFEFDKSAQADASGQQAPGAVEQTTEKGGK